MMLGGSGKNYSSLSGHRTLIGAKSGKIIDYETRIKHCRMCIMGQIKEGQSPPLA